MIANTAGWDTDCNSGNVGCLMGIKNGLAGIDAGPDWRGPVADRMFLATADGGRAITDALRESYAVVNVGRALAGQAPVAPKQGVRFHFDLPGAVQGFRCEDSPEARGTVTVENVAGHAEAGRRSLALRYRAIAPGRAGRVATATFVPAETLNLGGYGLLASPTLYSGQAIRARVVADPTNPHPASVGLHLRIYGKGETLEIRRGPTQEIGPGEAATLIWEAPDTEGMPIAEVGVEIGGASGTGRLYLDWLTWDGTPRASLGRPDTGDMGLWRRAWVSAVDTFDGRRDAEMVCRVIQNEGVGMVIQGEREWADYTATVAVRPHMAAAVGLAVNVRGLFRYAALVLGADGAARLVERYDDTETVLAEAPVRWALDRDYRLALTSRYDGAITARIDDGPELQATLAAKRAAGAIALWVQEGHCLFGAARVAPTEA
jgi:hypothetical protein